jgi:uncharacterized protein
VIDPLVICFGLGVGLLIGLTGIGGGSLMTPLLILFAGVQPVVAIGTDLAYGAITKTVLGSALGVVNKAGAEIPTWTIVAVPALVGLGVFAVYRLRSRTPEVVTA